MMFNSNAKYRWHFYENNEQNEFLVSPLYRKEQILTRFTQKILKKSYLNKYNKKEMEKLAHKKRK
jgi:hypothetical protein